MLPIISNALSWMFWPWLASSTRHQLLIILAFSEFWYLMITCDTSTSGDHEFEAAGGCVCDWSTGARNLSQVTY